MMSNVTRKVVFSLLLILPACGQAPDEGEELESQQQAEIAACGLDDGTVEKHAKLRACDPGDEKKTTICHVPPGNPANAHTICIGNAAVKHHLKHHDDYLGPCKVEKPCPPMGGSGGSGGAAAGGAGGSSAGGAGGMSVGGAGGSSIGGAGGMSVGGAGGTGAGGAASGGTGGGRIIE